jgi:O-antigen ligase
MSDDLAPQTATAVVDAPPPPDRPAPPAAAEAPAPEGRRRALTITGIVIMAILAAASLGLVFRSGAYSPADWLPFMIGVGALALMVAISSPTVTAGPLQRVLLGAVALLAVWTTLSIFWASSLGDTWEEINRTAFYVLVIALVFAGVRWSGPTGLRVLATLIVVIVGITAVVIAVKLATDSDAIGMLPHGRLNYPITYFNGIACFLMVGFWLCLGLANGMGGAPSRRKPGRRTGAYETPGVPSDGTLAVPQTQAVMTPTAATPVDSGAGRLAAEPKRPPRASTFAIGTRVAQPLLLMLAVFLLEFALLPQSRGALWTFVLVIPFFVIFSPNRFRALADLAMVAIPLVLFWGRINGVYTAVNSGGPLSSAIDSALRGVGLSLLFVLVAWAITYVVERLLTPRFSRRATFIVGLVLVAILIVLLVIGLVYADHRTGGLGEYLGDRWSEFTSDRGTGTGDTSGRFAAFGLNGRLTQWKVAGRAFEDHPVLGIGAQNFEAYHYLHRTVAMDVRNPHSQPMQLLAELGVPGLVLYVVFVLVALARGVVLRFRARSRADMAVLAALFTACLAWFIHSSADWLWQLAGLTVPVMMLFAGLIAAGGPWWGVAPPPGALPQPAPPRDPSPVAAALAVLDAESAPTPPRRSEIIAARRAAKRRFRWLPRYTHWVAAVLTLAVIASAAFPYLSLRFSTTAVRSTDLAVVDSRAKTAAWLDPTAVHPFASRASAYTIAAGKLPIGSRERADELRTAAEAWIDASRRVPVVWLNSYMAANALVVARDAAAAAGMTADAQYLGQSARMYLEKARNLNPLSPQVKNLEKSLQAAGGA